MTLGTFADERGVIEDLLSDVVIDRVTRIHSVKGAIRGNHYHREANEWVYVLNGCLRVVVQEGCESQPPNDLRAGSLFSQPPGSRHAWLALEETDVLVFTQLPASGIGFEDDTVRLDPDSRLL